MTREVVGVVQEMLDKSTDKGQEYVVIRVDGEGYFDWRGLAAENQVKTGDMVRLRVGSGKWPRVYDLEKLEGEAAQSAAAEAAASGQAAQRPAGRTYSRENVITRLSCARTASLVLSVAEMPLEDRAKELFRLADKLEEWVTRPNDAEGKEEPEGSSGSQRKD